MSQQSAQSVHERLGRWRHILHLAPQVAALVYRAHPLGAIAIPALTLLSGPLPALQLFFMKRLIDGVTSWQKGDAAARTVVVTYLALTLGAGLGRSILNRIGAGLERMLRLRLADYLQERIISHTVTLDLASFETPAFYDSLQRARREASDRPFIIVQALIRGGNEVLTLLGLMVVLVTLAWWLVPFIALLVLPSLITQAKFGRLSWRISWGRTPEERRQLYFQEFLTSDQSAKEVRLFGLADHLTGRWRELVSKFYREDRQVVIREGIWDLGILVFQCLGSIAYYGYVIYRTVRDPAVTIGSMVMYIQTMERAQGSLSLVVSSLATLYENALYMDNLFEFFKHKPSIVAPPDPAPVPTPIARGIELNDVTFRYPNSDREALSNVTLRIGAGERIALVGENGAGKTTLVKLLARLYDPQQGSISVDGVNLRQIDPLEWRRQIAVIFQDFGRYHVSARENVGFGRVEQMDDTERVRKAADLSGAAAAVGRLEHGWETILGKVFEKGQDLSLGEWQKVALARVFFRDAPILILDEPTASLDAKQEHEIFSRFQELTAGRTTVLISHRFSTVRMADRIFVIEHGQLVETGSHDELMGLHGRYASLFNRQAKGYR